MKKKEVGIQLRYFQNNIISTYNQYNQCLSINYVPCLVIEFYAESLTSSVHFSPHIHLSSANHISSAQ